jgi:hypothetical protein
MSTVVPFDDGHRFVVGVRALIPVVTVVAGIAGAIASNVQHTGGTNLEYPAFVYFSVRAAIFGYLSGFVAGILAIVASRWSRWTSGLAAAMSIAVLSTIATMTFDFANDFLGLLPPLWFLFALALAVGIGVALLPHPTVHIEWSTIIGRNKYMLFTQPIVGEMDAQMSELSRRLDLWDPIGVYDFMSADQWPHGEYNDLVIPVLEVLKADVRPHELARELVAVLKHDYGLHITIADADPIALELVEWYAAESVTA